jgi:hypothetical protein
VTARISSALHDVFHAILGWTGDLGYLVRVHGQEFNSFRRRTRSKALRDFQLHRSIEVSRKSAR